MTDAECAAQALETIRNHSVVTDDVFSFCVAENMTEGDLLSFCMILDDYDQLIHEGKTADWYMKCKSLHTRKDF